MTPPTATRAPPRALRGEAASREVPMSRSNPTRRTVLKSGAALAGVSVVADTAIAQAPAITGGSESKFPSPDAPGSNEGGYNILFILTDQEQYMGYSWP